MKYCFGNLCVDLAKSPDKNQVYGVFQPILKTEWIDFNEKKTEIGSYKVIFKGTKTILLCLWANGTKVLFMGKRKFHPNWSPKTAQSFKLLHIWNFKKSLFMSHSNTWPYCCVQNRPVRYLEISTGLIFCLGNWYDDELPQLDKILVYVILQKISFCGKLADLHKF